MPQTRTFSVTVLFPSAQNGYTPLHIAAKKNQMEITTTLLEYGAPTNTVTRQGITPMHLAAQEGNIDVVTLLLARDAPVNVCNKVGGLWVNAQGGRGFWCWGESRGETREFLWSSEHLGSASIASLV